MIRKNIRVGVRAVLAAAVVALLIATAGAQAVSGSDSQDQSTATPLHWLPGKPPEAAKAEPVSTDLYVSKAKRGPVPEPASTITPEDPRPTAVRTVSHAAEIPEVVPKPVGEPAASAAKVSPPPPELIEDSSSEAFEDVEGQAPGARRGGAAAGPGRFAPDCNDLPGIFDDDDECLRRPLGMEPGWLGDCGQCVAHRRIWTRVESLAWWTKGFDIPPLLTTSPPGTDPANSGVLGLSTTTVLLGGDQVVSGFHPGGRVTLGGWLDPCCETADIEATFTDLGEMSERFNLASNGNPILARPFFDVSAASQSSSVFATNDPVFLAQGSFRSVATSDFWGTEILMRRLLTRSDGYRIDMLAGFRYAYLMESLRLFQSATFDGTGNSDPNTGNPVQANVFDEFATVNRFYGGEVGFSSEWRQNRWSVENSLKLAIGDTLSRTSINGATAFTVGGVTTNAAGGFLALPSNIGNYNRSQVSVLPEIDSTLGFNLTPGIRFTVGYALMYWSHVTRPGDQIDSSIDPAQFPTIGAVTPTGAKPQFQQQTSDYWAQGVNLGMDFRF